MSRFSRRDFLRYSAVGAGALGFNVLPRVSANAVTTTVGTVGALVKAVNNVPPGSIIHVRSGFYDVTGLELRPADRVSILGSGHTLGSDGYLETVGTHIHIRGYRLLTRRSFGIRCENIWFSGARRKYDAERGWVAGTGSNVFAPYRATFRYCKFSDADIAGLSAWSGLLERCEIFRCGGDYSTSGKWAVSSAMKAHTQTHALYNYVHDCGRHGLWWDRGAEDYRCVGNKVERIKLYGIIVEKSQRANVERNTVNETGFQGMVIARSRYVDASSNRFSNNSNGGLQVRDSHNQPEGGFNCTGIKVLNNSFGKQKVVVEKSIAIPGELTMSGNTGITEITRP